MTLFTDINPDELRPDPACNLISRHKGKQGEQEDRPGKNHTLHLHNPPHATVSFFGKLNQLFFTLHFSSSLTPLCHIPTGHFGISGNPFESFKLDMA
jgi:hypothetical protein